MELKIAFIHFAVVYKKSEQNKAELLRKMYQAGESGARIIITPEMAVSGYSFKDRSDIADFVEEENGAFAEEVGALAERFGCYICVGLALRHQKTDGYCNSALVRGPGGFSFRYDKVNGEIRWSMPGNPKQKGCFDTPWGKVGVLICSDTYYDLQPRITALKGADLILVPANWPPSGLDPVEVWRARSLENGVAIAGCNRTGRDLQMSCEEAESCLISPEGEILFRKSSRSSAIFNHSLPLTGGMFDQSMKNKRLGKRKVENYHDCYRSVNIVRDLGSFLELPGPGKLLIRCLASKRYDGSEIAAMPAKLTERKQKSSSSEQDETLVLLSMEQSSLENYSRLEALAEENKLFLCAGTGDADHPFQVFGPTGVVKPGVDNNAYSVGLAGSFDIGPARVNFMSYQELLQPENVVSISKNGCDLLVVDSPKFDDEVKLICGVRTISHLCIALCRDDGAGIWMVPEGHARWGEILRENEGECDFILDTALTRKKRFQDRLDFDTLLQK